MILLQNYFEPIVIQFDFVKTEEKGVFWKESVANTDKVNFSWILTLFYPLLEFIWIVRTAFKVCYPLLAVFSPHMGHGTYQVFRQISEVHSGGKQSLEDSISKIIISNTVNRDYMSFDKNWSKMCFSNLSSFKTWRHELQKLSNLSCQFFRNYSTKGVVHKLRLLDEVGRCSQNVLFLSMFIS